MDGILLVDKEKGITSRDVVNKISKELNIKKVGHAGTLDPLATGLMIIGIGKGTKILDLLTLNDKEYIATVKIGIQTDTFDITGNIIKQDNYYNINKEKLINTLNMFCKKYMQTVPKYSAVKKNGKKLYEYARENINIELPKKEVEIYEIELLNYDNYNQEFTFRTLVSKGTYIRSLINDIGEYLNVPMTMKELRRTRSGKFTINNINGNIIPIKDCFDYKKIIIEDEGLLKKIKNGNKIKLNYDDNYLLLLDKNERELGLYIKENDIFKVFKMF